MINCRIIQNGEEEEECWRKRRREAIPTTKLLIGDEISSHKTLSP